jgi:hypothetical protein
MTLKSGFFAPPFLKRGKGGLNKCLIIPLLKWGLKIPALQDMARFIPYNL